MVGCRVNCWNKCQILSKYRHRTSESPRCSVHPHFPPISYYSGFTSKCNFVSYSFQFQIPLKYAQVQVAIIFVWGSARLWNKTKQKSWINPTQSWPVFPISVKLSLPVWGGRKGNNRCVIYITESPHNHSNYLHIKLWLVLKSAAHQGLRTTTSDFHTLPSGAPPEGPEEIQPVSAIPSDCDKTVMRHGSRGPVMNCYWRSKVTNVSVTRK